MRVLHVGDLNGLPYRLVQALREHAGVDAELYVPEGYEPTGLDWSRGVPSEVITFEGNSLSLPERIRVMREYDVVQPCGMGIIYSWFSGKPTTPYSMGSDLRVVAKQKDLIGEFMRSGFKRGKRVFYSCVDQTRLIEGMGLISEFIPQALPEIKERERCLEGEFKVFSPARLNFEAKGTLKLIQAIKNLPTRVKHRMVFEFVDWGVDAARARELLSRSGARVNFVPLLTRGELYDKFASSDLVAGQFSVGAFGLLELEAMACGACVLTKMDAGDLVSCYGSAPGLLSASGSDEIKAELEYAFDNPREVKYAGACAKSWVKRRHDARAIALRVKRVYEEVME